MLPISLESSAHPQPDFFLAHHGSSAPRPRARANLWARRALRDEESGGGGLLYSPGIVAREVAVRWAASGTLSGNTRRSKASRAQVAKRRGFRPRAPPQGLSSGTWGAGDVLPLGRVSRGGEA